MHFLSSKILFVVFVVNLTSEGTFVNGLLEGHGIWRSAIGDFYEGNWEEGCKHGQGRLVTANGDEYEGALEFTYPLLKPIFPKNY